MGAGSGLLPFGLEAKQPFTWATRIVTLPTPHSFARTFSALRSLFHKIPFLLETEILARRWMEELSNINCIQVCVGWDEPGPFPWGQDACSAMWDSNSHAAVQGPLYPWCLHSAWNLRVRRMLLLLIGNSNGHFPWWGTFESCPTWHVWSVYVEGRDRSKGAWVCPLGFMRMGCVISCFWSLE